MSGFMTISGRPWAAKAGLKKAKIANEEPKHFGWRVVGFSPDMIESGEAYAKAQKKEFIFEKWAKVTKKKAAREKPYEILAAARQCAMLMERAGWVSVEIVEVTRGVK